MTGVKVCGLTRAEDVRLAAELGAWALGFVLTGSPRRVSVEQAARLMAVARVACARPVVGGAPPAGGETRTDGAAPVVGGAPPAGGTAEAGAAGPHDGAVGAGARRDPPLLVAVVAAESPAWIAAALAESGADAVQLSAGADGPTVAAVREAAARLRRRPRVIAAADTPDALRADHILLDARAPAAYGGTGTVLDWEALAADPSTPGRGLVLAGGLHAGNVGHAIALLHPAVVDVSSGVESAPGIKDHGRVRELFAAVEDADRGRPAREAPPAADTSAGRNAG